MNPTAIGDVSEAIVIAAFVKAGRRVLLPFGNNERYDLVVDHGDRFERVQIKTGVLERGGVTFRPASMTTRGGKPVMRDYHGQIDSFAVYCRKNDSIYVVPISRCGTREMFLRFEPAKNGQSKGVNMASEFIWA